MKDAAVIPEVMKSDESFICHITTGNYRHVLHGVLQCLYLTQTLQTCVFYVNTLIQLDFLHVLETL